MDYLKNWLIDYPILAQFFYAIGIIIFAIVGYFITKKIILRALSKIVAKSKTQIDDILLDHSMLKRVAYIAPVLIIYNFAYLFPDIEELIHRGAVALISVIILLISGAFLTALNNYYEKLKIAEGKPIKSYVQVIKLVVYIVGIIIIIAVLIGQSPWFLLTGLGAMTAVILLIFRDTILSFVASLQMSSNDLVRVGDWIEVPTYGADGDVIDIALHTIKIQNWDKTITVIPTHKLIEVSFKNWRGMQMTGGRRIKRSLYIDQNSIKFCDNEMIKRYADFQLIRDYINKKQEEIAQYNQNHGYSDKQLVNGRRMTNIGTFRAYIEAYLKQNEKVHNGLTMMVRQLAPGPNGLPLEIYAFANDTAWIRYEGIQSDIFDHILAVVAQFDLRIFQNPSGEDFRHITSTI
jgi:miniconductance mechanosensitive channel